MQRITASAKFVLPQIATATGNLYFRLAFFKFWQIHPQNFSDIMSENPLLSPFSCVLSPISCHPCLSTVSHLLSHFSCLPSPVSLTCLQSPFSRLPSPVYWLPCLSPVSRLLSPVFCLPSPVTRLLSHISCRTSPVSVSHVPCLTSPSPANLNDTVRVADRLIYYRKSLGGFTIFTIHRFPPALVRGFVNTTFLTDLVVLWRTLCSLYGQFSQLNTLGGLSRLWL